MKKITAYETTDGKVFSSEKEAKNHEYHLALKQPINDFVNSSYCKYNNQAHRIIVEKTIAAWEAWCNEKGRMPK